MPHARAARTHLAIAERHLRIAVDDDELDPVDVILAESLLIGWKRDSAVLDRIVERDD